MENAGKMLDALCEQRILILDGAMGSLIQKQGLGEAEYRGERFADHPVNVQGCNDLLVLTRPELVASIHQGYLEAGADIISSCSFNAGALTLADYGLAGMAYEINRAAAALAREAACRYSTKEKPRFAAGSIGPSSKSLSISPDVNDPGKRDISWDAMEAAYYDYARGLIDGGVQILLLETIFDTLNAKAALSAIARLAEERNAVFPLMISATVSGASGRILSGQTVEAFAVSVLHSQPFSLGLNCSFGAEKMLPHLETLSAFSPVRVSCHPNAGLPNRFGLYDESPEETAAFFREFFERGLVNIAGGCCGTTPEHIAAIARLAVQYRPRKIPAPQRRSFLAGLEVLDLDKGFTVIGERTNTAGSGQFLRLVKEGAWEKALDAARETIAAGAGIINAGMDDPFIDGKDAMSRFLKLCLSDPEIARVPLMADSSSWDVHEEAMKHMQGKGVVNSISLKEGEAEFIRRARLARRYGAAVLVMLFDEEGQAAGYERRIAVAERSYKLLLDAGIPAGDIIFDPNVFAAVTGMSEHDSYAPDFIRACSWIREHCEGVHLSGGISNLSFSFRGNRAVRAAMHSVFLKHAREAGLSLAIVNPADVVSCGELDPALREAAEDAVLCRGNNPSEKLLALALKTGAGTKGMTNTETIRPGRESGVQERIVYALVNGSDGFIEQDILEAKETMPAIAIVEGPLMDGMKETGKRFAEGTMFLPQVLRSARVMKKAFAVLEPFMKEEEKSGKAGTIVLATVQGDVHDIGKNIVKVVMSCNAYEVIDLGVMVPCETILAAAEEASADCIGLSGLISPSLEEMVRVACEMERRKLAIPLLIGGAASSLAYTGIRIAPAYSGPVVYIRDAAETATALHALFSPERPAFLAKLEEAYRKERERHADIAERRILVSLEEARANRLVSDWEKNPPPGVRTEGIIQYDDYSAEKLVPRIDWNQFYSFWELKGENVREGREKEKLYGDAQAMLAEISSRKLLELRAVLGFFRARSEDDDLVLYGVDQKETGRFCFLRSQQKKAGQPNRCLADFVPEAASPFTGSAGLFALSAGFGFEKAAAVCREQDGEYGVLLLASLAARLAEAFAEELCHKALKEFWDTPYPGIRPAFGYPSCPDHYDKFECFRLLQARERAGLDLSETAMMLPAQSVCGMIFAHPRADYFGTGEIAEDQLTGWARRKNITLEEARKRARTLV